MERVKSDSANTTTGWLQYSQERNSWKKLFFVLPQIADQIYGWESDEKYWSSKRTPLVSDKPLVTIPLKFIHTLKLERFAKKSETSDSFVFCLYSTNGAIITNHDFIAPNEEERKKWLSALAQAGLRPSNPFADFWSPSKKQLALARKDVAITGYPHLFKLRQFGSPTWCETCGEFIWGLVLQGYQCTLCQFKVHKDCKKKTQLCCTQDYRQLSTKNLIGEAPLSPIRYIVTVKEALNNVRLPGMESGDLTGSTIQRKWPETPSYFIEASPMTRDEEILEALARVTKPITSHHPDWLAEELSFQNDQISSILFALKDGNGNLIGEAKYEIGEIKLGQERKFNIIFRREEEQLITRTVPVRLLKRSENEVICQLSETDDPFVVAEAHNAKDNFIVEESFEKVKIYSNVMVDVVTVSMSLIVCESEFFSPPVSPRKNDGHHFRSIHFKRPTWCDFCSQFIWGLGKQGVQCQICKYNSHHGCQLKIQVPCPGLL